MSLVLPLLRNEQNRVLMWRRVCTPAKMRSTFLTISDLVTALCTDAPGCAAFSESSSSVFYSTHGAEQTRNLWLTVLIRILTPETLTIWQRGSRINHHDQFVRAARFRFLAWDGGACRHAIASLLPLCFVYFTSFSWSFNKYKQLKVSDCWSEGRWFKPRRCLNLELDYKNRPRPSPCSDLDKTTGVCVDFWLLYSNVIRKRCFLFVRLFWCGWKKLWLGLFMLQCYQTQGLDQNVHRESILLLRMKLSKTLLPFTRVAERRDQSW